MESVATSERSRGGRSRRNQVEDRREHLLDTAADLFGRNGYERTSLDQIATIAKVGKATIYARYGNKAGFLKAVVDHVLKHKRMTIDTPNAGQAGIMALKEQLANNIATALQPSYIGLFRLYLGEAAAFPEIFDIFPARGEAHQLLLEQIEGNEEFREILPYKGEIVDMLVTMTGALVTIAATRPEFSKTVSPKDEASRLVETCLYGFYGRVRGTSGTLPFEGNVEAALDGR